MQGSFIVIEGIDGCGSTTQAQLLFDYFSSLNKKIYLTNEPSKSVVGEMTRQLLQDRKNETKNLFSQALALSFAADRLLHLLDEIIPKLKEGFSIICDRYVLSSLVYNSMECEEKWIRELNKYALKADCTFLLDVSADIAFDRINKRGSSKDFFEKIDIPTLFSSSFLKNCTV